MRVALLLSGGVDSSVALVELVRAGHTVEAYYIKIWLEDEAQALGNCPWREDMSMAQAVCARYGVQLRVVSLQAEYHRYIVEHALAELRSGATPSPDVRCNQKIKFDLFFSRIDQQYDRVASGHYARIVRTRRGAFLYSGRDRAKDQSYFLLHLSQQQLARLVFPLGALNKREVRRRALRYGLPNAGRPDSQGLCFLGTVRFSDFVRHYLGERKGQIVERESGRVLGSHQGYWLYTLGQRRALRLSGGPWYVVGKECEGNTIMVSRRPQNYLRSVCELDYLHFNNSHISVRSLLHKRLGVKVRHAPELNGGWLTQLSEGRYALRLRRPELIPPGQYAALYSGRRCIGGGRIGTDSQRAPN